MKLQSFSIENFRSITTAKKIVLDQISTLIWKNNEGKSNILSALWVAMNILRMKAYWPKSYTNRFIYHRNAYDWERDFPIDIQNNRKKKIKETIFRLEFSFTNDELSEFKKHTGKTLNWVLEFKITCWENTPTPKIEIIKTGTNTKSWTDEKTIATILKYIMWKIDFVYIPAVRTEDQAITTIENIIASRLTLLEVDEDYQNALHEISKKQEKVLSDISRIVETSLKTFIADIKEVEMKVGEDRRKYFFRRSVDIFIDDGVKTSIEYKWDWIKSLVALSILKDSNIWSGVSLIAIEEPESHLHPWAIHSLREVIYSLIDNDNNQVLISTHNPIFVNHENIKSNIIVDSRKANPAKNIKEIRETLWVRVSDDLLWARFVLLVEWIEDEKALIPIIDKFGSNKLKNALKKWEFAIHYSKGASNISYRLDLLKSQMCKVFVLLDNDDSWKQALKNAIDHSRLSPNQYMQTMVKGKTEAEFEDLISPDIFKDDILNKYWVNIDDKTFTKSKKKFSDAIKELFEENWKQFSDEIKKDLKNIVSTSIKWNENKAIKHQDKKIIEKLLENLDNLIV